MNEDKVTEILEGFEISEDKIVQIISQLKERFKNETVKISTKDNFLDLQIENEKDPLKKAALVASRISKSFEEE